MRGSSSLDLDRIRLVSFDIFDTVIARRCGAPESVFRIVGEKMKSSGVLQLSPAEFQKQRMESELRVRDRKGKAEITLSEIYLDLDSRGLFARTAADQVAACELETERENIFLIPSAADLIDGARSAGKRVAFVSDMYLPEEFLRSILSDLGVIRMEDSFYVSSRWGATKAGGELYRIVLEREGLLAEEVLHIGDSRHSDWLRARQAGMQAMQVSRGALNQYEVALTNGEDRGGTVQLTGISRLARLEHDRCGRQSVASTLGASVAGPLLTSYAEWVLRTARSRNLRRLYFLARDGEALLRLCEKLSPALCTEDIELRYLHGSRQVWYPAALRAMDDRAAEFFEAKVSFAERSWRECVQLLGFDPAAFEGTSFAQRWNNRPINAETRRLLFQELATDPRQGPTMKRWLTEQTALTTRYLSEAGLIGNVSCGLVDCGWSGTWTDILGDLIEAEGGARPEVCFLGRRRGKYVSRSTTHTFLFDHQLRTGLETVPDFFHVVVEFLLTAGHGRTESFREELGRLSPVLAAVDLQGFKAEEWQIYREALLRFAELYAQQVSAEATGPEPLRKWIDPVVLLWERPSIAEAQFLGRHAVGLSPSGESGERLARGYRVADVFRLALTLRLPGYPPWWWHEGAQALTRSFAVRLFMGVFWESLRFGRALLHRVRGGNNMAITSQFRFTLRRMWRGWRRRQEDACDWPWTEQRRLATAREPVLSAIHETPQTTKSGSVLA